MGSSLAFRGGSEVYHDESVSDESDVLRVVGRFIEERFKSGSDVAEEVRGDSDKRIVLFASEDESSSPATLGQKEEDELVVYGSVFYRAREHSVQTIWENNFEIRRVNNGVYIRVSGWSGPTVDTWVEKTERDVLFV